MAFKPRTTAPSADDPNAISVIKGGKNHALMINSRTGSVYPNCCGHVHTRALELCGEEVEIKLCRGNACSYYGYTKDGLSRGMKPKLGAIAVWSGGSKGYGHVATVEAIYSDGSFLAGNSNYSGTVFYTMRVYAPAYSPWSGYKLLGFIYLPWEAETKYFGKTTERDTSKHQVEVLSKVLRARKRPEMNDKVILGLMNAGVMDVVETRDMTAEASNGYFWYSPEPNVWFARKDGEWTNDLPASVIDVEELEKKLKELTEDNSRLKRSLEDYTRALTEVRESLEDAASTISGTLSA